MRNWNQNEFDMQSLALQKYLEEAAKEVIPTLPAPFGTFEKAKYEIKKHNISRPKNPYYFITSCHNTEDAIEILMQRKMEFTPYFVITKTVGGVEEILYQSPRNPHDFRSR